MWEKGLLPTSNKIAIYWPTFEHIGTTGWIHNQIYTYGTQYLHKVTSSQVKWFVPPAGVSKCLQDGGQVCNWTMQLFFFFFTANKQPVPSCFAWSATVSPRPQGVWPPAERLHSKCCQLNNSVSVINILIVIGTWQVVISDSSPCANPSTFIGDLNPHTGAALVVFLTNNKLMVSTHYYETDPLTIFKVSNL